MGRGIRESMSAPSSPERERRPRGMSESLSLEDQIFKFVITGGPCAGKTTGMERLQVFLRERGFRVFVVPEAATMLFLNGAFPDDLAKVACQEAFQNFVIKTQLTLEDCMHAYARSLNQKAVILCDRGIMDGSAYVDDETWAKVLRSVGMDCVAAREGRYDAIFHLVSAADGAESFYSLSNNNARHESVDEAKSMDKKTQRAWNGHPRHIIVDNRNGRSFERKMEQLVSMVAASVGLPQTLRRRHKFVLQGAPDLSVLPSEVQVFEVEKIMLAEGVGALPETTGGGDKVLYSFIRRRSQGGFHAYGLTTVKQLETGESVELKQVISSKVYGILSNSADKTRSVVRQRRYCFLWEQQSFHIYQFLPPHDGIWLCYCQSEEAEPVLPQGLPVASLLAGEESSFNTREISLIDRPHTPRLK